MIRFKTTKAMKPIKIFSKKANISWAEREVSFLIKGNGLGRSDNPAYYARLLESRPEFAFYEGAKAYAKQYADSKTIGVDEEIIDAIVSEMNMVYFTKQFITGKKTNNVVKIIDRKVVEYAYHYVFGFREYVLRKMAVPAFKYSSIKRRTPNISNPHRFFRPISGLNAQYSNRKLIESGDLINAFTARVYDGKGKQIIEVN